MSLWSWATAWLRSGLTAQDDELYRTLGGVPTDTAESVTATSVMGLSTAWACVSLLSGTIASLSAGVFRKDDRLVKVPAGYHPLQSVLDDPNADQTPIDFWEMMSLSLELWGNAYAEVDRNSAGDIIALTPVRPELMMVERTRSGALRYRWHDKESHERPEDAILHIRGNGGDPMGGMSTIAWNRNTFGTAQAIERSAGRTFANGIRSSGVFAAKEKIPKEKMEEAAELIERKYTGAMNAGRPMLLNGDLSYHPITFKPDEAQMLESRGFSVEEICRIFGVPPFMVGRTEKSTSWGTGIEQQILGFQKFTLRKRLKKIEQAVRKQLMSPEDRRAGYSVSFNIEDLLRGDSKARASFYQTMTQIGAMTINEVRALEGLPPVEGGDVPRMQMQNQPITETDGIGHNGGPPLEDEE